LLGHPWKEGFSATFRGDYEKRMDALFVQFLASDKFCPSQR